MISKQLRREVGTKRVQRTPRKVIKRKVPLRTKAKQIFWKALKRTGEAAKRLPIEVTREVSRATGKPIPKKLKHKKVTGYEAAFGRSLFK